MTNDIPCSAQEHESAKQMLCGVFQIRNAASVRIFIVLQHKPEENNNLVVRKTVVYGAYTVKHILEQISNATNFKC